MIIYNVTICVDKEVEYEWVEWMRSKHIIEVMQTNCFFKYQFGRIISHKEQDTTSYTVAYFCENMKKLHEYQTMFANKLQKDHQQNFENTTHAFRTLIEVIKEH